MFLSDDTGHVATFTESAGLGRLGTSWAGGEQRRTGGGEHLLVSTLTARSAGVARGKLYDDEDGKVGWVGKVSVQVS